MKLTGIFIFLFAGMLIAQSAVEKFTPQLDAVATNTNQNEELLVWVFFSDKGDQTQLYLNKPNTVVSEKSLKRRSKVLSQDKLITNTDLPVNKNYIDQLNSLGFEVKQKSKWFNGVSGWATAEELVQFANLSFVKQLDIVYRFRKNNFEEESIENDSEESGQQFSKPTGINSFDYGQSFTQLNQITVPQVHDLGYTGTGVTICMMDAGFDLWSTHQVFSSMNVIATWDFVNGDADVENGSDMGNGSHGTSTLSLIGGFYEGQLIGPAFDANFILAKTENTDSETPIEEDNWIAAMEWADSIGVDVTSTSLSYLDYDPPYPSYTWEDMDGNTARITNGADYAVYIGIFVANSAGNYGNNPSHNTLGAPADGDSVMAIGSVNSSGTRSNFSSVGPTADGRIKPDLMAMGSSDYVACNNSNTCYSDFGSGTSWSCPLAAGTAALLLQVSPNLTPMELVTVLKNTASNSSSPNNLYGWGIINTYAAVQSLLTDVDYTNNIPEDYYLLQNYPNPFNPSTKIRFAVPEKSQVKLSLYDVLGKELAVILNEEINPGIQEVELNGNDLSSGIYLVRMTTNNYQQTIKISLLK
ncbi:MAG: S8/S53 family peptidase [Ignavibacteriales bacterium]